ncbi:hypothetical protein BACINT_01372 [Bacteroides intestinalis DSM 17393]|uniref:Uncharacterized protein n=1 Tax=Bacteroides intestinalis DSM 17393 TaxID=471870 RepID=B3CA58_9BACE|nr:hypothetical protein BACINT_01372 [Bacteroides intestinalis DSM 17393]
MQPENPKSASSFPLCPPYYPTMTKHKKPFYQDKKINQKTENNYKYEE